MVESETDLSKAEKQVKGGRSLTEERNFEKKKKKKWNQWGKNTNDERIKQKQNEEINLFLHLYTCMCIIQSRANNL